MSKKEELTSDRVFTPDDVERLRNCVNEGINSLYRKQAELDIMKELSKRVEEELLIPKKDFRKLVTLAYKDEAEKFDQEATAILDMAEAIGRYES